jgi:predicted NUDIX family NTP pyrophosphohydrolase
LHPLGELRQAGGKWVTAFTTEQDLDPATIRSNAFEIEWPPRSGTLRSFPEVSAARWLEVEEARQIMLASQRPLLDRLIALVG